MTRPIWHRPPKWAKTQEHGFFIEPLNLPCSSFKFQKWVKNQGRKNKVCSESSPAVYDSPSIPATCSLFCCQNTHPPCKLRNGGGQDPNLLALALWFRIAGQGAQAKWACADPRPCQQPCLCLAVIQRKHSISPLSHNCLDSLNFSSYLKEDRKKKKKMASVMEY